LSNAAYPTGILLNEFVASPKAPSSSEWVELYNGGDEQADLEGWKIDDEDGGGAPYSLPPGSAIAPHGLFVATLPHALLNNGGDRARLLRPDGTVADEFVYTASVAGMSFCRIDDTWTERCTPSPNAPNQSIAPAGDAAGDTPTAIAPAEPAETPGTASEPDESFAAVAAVPHGELPLRASGESQYSLALPGSLYQGIGTSTPVPSPSAPPMKHHEAPSRTRSSAPASSTPPAAPLTGGVLSALGVILAGYDRWRSRQIAPCDVETAADTGEPQVDETHML
jgi:hypothetical protein